MAHITIPDENKQIDDPAAIVDYLAPLGIHYERWPLEERVDPNAAPEVILDAYAVEIDHLKKSGGYVSADVVNITSQTPNLEALLDRFRKEHTHSEDEVRFILKGRGIFHIHPKTGPVIALQVEAGDLINVPAGTQHWFDLCKERNIRAIRLFQDMTGWTPHYVADPVNEGYQPMCFSPREVAAEPIRFTAPVRP